MLADRIRNGVSIGLIGAATFSAGALAALRAPFIGAVLWVWIGLMNPHRLGWGFAYSLPLAMAAGLVTLIGVLATKQYKMKLGVPGGVLLALARIAGETAPLLFTALSNQFWSSSLNQPMASLPVTIFKFAMSPYENWQKLAWAGVFLITLGVLMLNILARVLFRNKH